MTQDKTTFRDLLTRLTPAGLAPGLSNIFTTAEQVYIHIMCASIPKLHTVAQLVEHLPGKREVMGSNTSSFFLDKRKMGCLRCCCVVCHLYCLITFLISTSVHVCKVHTYMS